MIDEKVLIERLEEELKLADGEKEKCARGNPLMFDNAKGYSTGISTAISIVKDLASEYNNGWIMVEDVLPGECEIVLFCTKYGYVRQGSRHIRYEHNTYDLAGVTHTFSDDEIVAWQPLPQTPKKGE